MFDYHHSCVSVGLAHGEQMIAGFVYHPYVDDMYVAVRGHGSYLNGKRLQMADKPVEEESWNLAVRDTMKQESTGCSAW